MSAITTHVLDTASGHPAAGVPVVLEFKTSGGWTEIGRGETNEDGRLRELLAPDFDLLEGAYRLHFDTSRYYSTQKTDTFYPTVTVAFIVADAAQHYHVPLLLSPYGYSTYRGS